MNQETRFLLEIIKYLLNNKTGSLPIPDEYLDWERLVKFAAGHSVMNLLFYGVECLPQESRPEGKKYHYLRKQAIAAMVKNCNQLDAAEELLECFEAKGIYVLAVKGVCTKLHYPQSDMRTMGDIDLLYQDVQQEKVK